MWARAILTAFSTAFGPGAEEDRLLLALARRQRAQALGQAQVGLVHDDLERGVGDPIELGLDRLHHVRVAVADVHHADAAGEVDVAATGDVPELGPLGVIGDDRDGPS